MTEVDWFERDFDPRSIVRCVWGTSERKLRLFACHCCRRVWDDLGALSRAAVEVAEQFADDEVTTAELRAARLALASSDEAGLLGWYASGSGAAQAAEQVARVCTLRPELVPTAVQAAMLRDIFWNTFRPVSFSPEWRTDTAVSLARQLYESREFSAMPILADALQDAGCDRDDVLNHCRDATLLHVRGCWVIDLVLGKK